MNFWYKHIAGVFDRLTFDEITEDLAMRFAKGVQLEVYYSTLVWYLD